MILLPVKNWLPRLWIYCSCNGGIKGAPLDDTGTSQGFGMVMVAQGVKAWVVDYRMMVKAQARPLTLSATGVLLLWHQPYWDMWRNNFTIHDMWQNKGFYICFINHPGKLLGPVQSVRFLTLKECCKHKVDWFQGSALVWVWQGSKEKDGGARRCKI